MWKWPTFSGLTIGVILLPMSANAGEWRYAGPVPAKSEVSPQQGAAQGMSTDRRSPALGGMVPRNNMTQDAVRNKYGDPQEQLSAVGEPPISRWRYVDYTVYFERGRVIISVPNDMGLTR
jgi:hypothetical protein